MRCYGLKPAIPALLQPQYLAQRIRKAVATAAQLTQYRRTVASRLQTFTNAAMHMAQLLRRALDAVRAAQTSADTRQGVSVAHSRSWSAGSGCTGRTHRNTHSTPAVIQPSLQHHNCFKTVSGRGRASQGHRTWTHTPSPAYSLRSCSAAWVAHHSLTAARVCHTCHMRPLSCPFTM